MVSVGTTEAGTAATERGSWASWYGDSEPHARIGYEADLIDPEAAWLRLTYTANGNPMDYRVRLVTTQLTYGGRRWWFLCPLVHKDGGPSRRAAKLYLPAGGRTSEAGKPMGLPTARARRAEVQWSISPARGGYGNRRGVHSARSEGALMGFPK